jgi:hypothetical protein
MSALDGSGTPERVGPDQVNAAPLFSGRELSTTCCAKS